MSVLSKSARFALAGVLSAMVAGVTASVAIAQDAKAAEAKDAKTETKPAATGGPVFIVIDPDRIRRESLAGKSINAEAEKYGKQFEDDNRKDEAGLRSGEQELQKLRASMPQDQFTEKARAFEQKVSEVQRTELRRRQAFERSFTAAQIKWQQAMMEASRDVAASHNADAVVQSQALLFYNTKWDVTNEIIDALNKRVTKIDFPPPKLEAETGLPATAGGASGVKTLTQQPQAQPQPQGQPSGGLKLPQ